MHGLKFEWHFVSYIFRLKMKVSSDTYCNLPEIILEKIKVNMERNPPQLFQASSFYQCGIEPGEKKPANSSYPYT